MRILNMQRRHASKAFYCLKKLLSIHAHAYAKSVAKGFFFIKELLKAQPTYKKVL
jgi:hypothetical protein